ncbi:FAD-binding protein [Nocardia terpenica]|uniref:FAD-binding oxidoreductase n=1 Tax=Nocardia terpenica TaxID=455432 RepID=UPI001894DFA0|nr:FAD-linked oxidase C-terminal domain-containing protein [Nocardia terpenica]MBF6061897.1 FAD-binding protein [Nocardia terpenica]MBF6106302.1 FAD-binding protein [Nocardia terpenica]MBF6110317.1 FAD-binding protein [Nocardia terpenica]MBF6120846.1 FAD-binding protein [Nocardia terpenica]MBF6151653.1 FAD-binding protein [Nocardia terpenica]
MLVTDPDILAGYRQDRALDPDAGTPLALVRPTTTEQVATVLRWASEHRVPVIPRGAGTGLSGGATAQDGALLLSTERMRAITVDPVTRTAVVQPGLLNADVKRAVAEHGLWYPPDPSSFEICSIGGNAATNAGGLCCVKYGVTTDYVLGMEVVLADGTALRLGGPRLKDSAGLSLTKLFVGSEGTLGVITELTLRLLPAQSPQSTVVATFSTLTAATAAILEITGRLRPSMLEFMDSVAINAVEDEMRMGLDRSAAGMLVARSDAPGEYAAREAATILELCEKSGAAEVFSTEDPDEGEAFCAARRFAIPALERKGPLLLEDVGVPLPRLGELIDGIAAIAARRQVLVSVIAHAGDGNTHPLIVYNPADAAESARAQQAFGEIMDLAIALGGTITGEHGVGRLKKAWLPDQLGPDVMALTRRIKDALDPQGILNPGAVL